MTLLRFRSAEKAIDPQGQAIAQAKRYIYLADSDIFASLYGDASLKSSTANPMSSNEQGEFDPVYLVDGKYRIVIEDDRGEILHEFEDVAVKNSHQSIAPTRSFFTVADLLDDVEMDYDLLDVDNVICVLVGGRSYIVASATATNHHVETAGGVKLFVQPGPSGLDACAFGCVGDGVTDDTGALQSWLDASAGGAGFIPKGVYAHSGLSLDPSKTYNIHGQSYDKDGVSGSVLKNIDTSGVHSIEIDNTPFVQNFDRQIRLANLTLMGNIQSGDGIHANQAMVFLENVWINDHGGHGYSATRCYSSSFRQVSFSNNYKSGFSANRALNLVHFDHCLFNGNSRVPGYSGCQLTGDVGADRNFSVTFTACDFSGNGAELSENDTAFGITIQHSTGVSLVGCYGEQATTRLLYADNTVSGLTITGGFWQDGVLELNQPESLTYVNNEHYDGGSALMRLIIDSGFPDARKDHLIRGNSYTGTVEKTFLGGAVEVAQYWNDAPPLAGEWRRGDVVYNSNVQGGGDFVGWVCTLPGNPGSWASLGMLAQVYQNHGDADAQLTVGASFPTNIWQSPLTTDRTVSLSSANTYSGAKFRITRTAGASGSAGLIVGTTGKTLAANQWCEVEFDGANWMVTAAGSL